MKMLLVQKNFNQNWGSKYSWRRNVMSGKCWTESGLPGKALLAATTKPHLQYSKH